MQKPGGNLREVRPRFARSRNILKTPCLSQASVHVFACDVSVRFSIAADFYCFRGRGSENKTKEVLDEETAVGESQGDDEKKRVGGARSWWPKGKRNSWVCEERHSLITRSDKGRTNKEVSWC